MVLATVIVVWASHTPHTDFVPKHTVFEYTATCTCLSVIFKLLSGLIPFASF